MCKLVFNITYTRNRTHTHVNVNAALGLVPKK